MGVKRRKDSNGRVLPDGVTQRGDGRYLYRVQKNGKTEYIYDRDLNKLKEKIKQYSLDLANGLNTDIAKMTLNEWMELYFEVYKKGKIKESTYYSRLGRYRCNVKEIGTLGSMQIRNIKRIHVIAHLKMLVEKKNLADGSIQGIISILHDAFQQLIYDNVILHNPVEAVGKEVKGRPAKKRKALEIDEMKTLIDFLKVDHVYGVYLPLVAIGLGTGLRAGELIGLTWDDINFEDGFISVNKNVNYSKCGQSKADYNITSVKTKFSNREIPMTNETREMLKKQREYQERLGIKGDIEIDGYKGFVFTTKEGTPFRNHGLDDLCSRMIKAANVWEEYRAKKESREPVVIPKHTPHYWRHTFCTRLVEAEVDYMSLKDLMGHSRVETSMNIYTTISREMKKRNRETLDKAIKIL